MDDEIEIIPDVVPSDREEPSLVVTTAADRVDAFDGETSLREAIAYANATPDLDGDGTSDTALITFASGAGEAFENGGTVFLTEGELTPTTNGDFSRFIRIGGDVDGDGASDVTIDAVGTSRIFSIDDGNVILNGLTLLRGEAGEGEAGGAIRVGITGDVRFSNGAVLSSEAGTRGGGIANEGVMSLFNVTVAGNNAGSFDDGGGIVNDNTMALTNVTISGNDAQRGGGIANRGDLFAFNVTIADNVASSFGGGVYQASGTATLRSATVTDNEVQGGGFGNGGGIYLEGGSTSLESSINLGNAGGNIGGGGTAAPLADDNSIVGFEGIDPATVFDGSLGDNGGPVQTVALLASSTNPAVDSAGPQVMALDARGEGRVDIPSVPNEPGIADLGAYELQAIPGPQIEITASLAKVDNAFPAPAMAGLFVDGVLVDTFSVANIDRTDGFMDYTASVEAATVAGDFSNVEIRSLTSGPGLITETFTIGGMTFDAQGPGGAYGVGEDVDVIAYNNGRPAVVGPKIGDDGGDEVGITLSLAKVDNAFTGAAVAELVIGGTVVATFDVANIDRTDGFRDFETAVSEDLLAGDLSNVSVRLQGSGPGLVVETITVDGTTYDAVGPAGQGEGEASFVAYNGRVAAMVGDEIGGDAPDAMPPMPITDDEPTDEEMMAMLDSLALPIDMPGGVQMDGPMDGLSDIPVDPDDLPAS